MHSLRARLFAFWVISLIACIAVGAMLVQLYRQSNDAQVGRAEAVLAHACDLIRDRYRYYTTGWRGPTPPLVDEDLHRDLTAAVALALARQDGVEGGIWQADAGPLAYAFPTYEGSGPKTDLPAAERERIQLVNEGSAREEQPTDLRVPLRSQTLLFHACPLIGPVPALTAWTMSRVQIGAADNPLRVGLGILLALMLGMSTWLTKLILLWTRHVREIESALARGDGDTMPPLTRTGERELDRIIDALNEALARLSAARRESESLAAEVALAERLAGLGRVAAGVAHEIRNPIAVMRLRAENALAGDDTRRRQALADVLEQVSRLDALVAELLAMTQRREPHPIVVELQQFLADRVRVHRDEAALRNIAVVTETAIGRVRIDPEMIGRILDNLMSNAIWHTPVDGKVIIQAKPSGRDVRFTVADTGAGVDSELRHRSFEPFVTGRLDGTGLGLAIARELADAHGGSLVLLHPGGETPGQGAVFALDLPGAMSCQPS